MYAPKGMTMTHANLSTLIRRLHPSFGTAHTLPIQPRERAITGRTLNEMCRVPCFHLFQIVPRSERGA